MLSNLEVGFQILVMLPSSEIGDIPTVAEAFWLTAIPDRCLPPGTLSKIPRKSMDGLVAEYDGYAICKGGIFQCHCQQGPSSRALKAPYFSPSECVT